MSTIWAWHEFVCRGAAKVSPDFDNPTAAGVWRRENPPLIFSSGPTLWKEVDGGRVGLERGELMEAFSEFAMGEEKRYQQQLDFGPIVFP